MKKMEIEKALQLRDDKNEYFGKLFKNGVKEDGISNYVGAVIQDNEDFVSMDTVITDFDEKLSLQKIITNNILYASEKENITIDAIETAMSAVKKVAETNLDSINNMQGGEILATLVAANIHLVLSATIQGIDGNISELHQSNGKDSTKFVVDSITPIAVIGMGDFSDEDIITPINASDNMAFTEREQTVSFVKDTLSYTFNVKKNPNDASSPNYAMEKGKNSVSVGDGSIELDDYEVSSKEIIATRTITVDSINYTATFDYAGGTIKIEISGNIKDGTKIYFSGCLSSKKLGEISGTVGIEIESQKYTSKTVIINASANSLDSRRVLQEGNLNLLSTSMGIAISKIAEETKAKKIDKAVRYATVYGKTVDLTAVGSNYASIKEQYKLFNITLESARADITVTSQITSKVALIGGSALVKIVSALSDSTEGNVRPIDDDNNSFRLLGYINGIYPAYYDPRHDKKYPLDGTNSDESTIFVVGTPSDPTKRAVISGVGLPIIPSEPIVDENSNKTIPLSGELVVDTNKDQRSKKLARTIKVKI